MNRITKVTKELMLQRNINKKEAALLIKQGEDVSELEEVQKR